MARDVSGACAARAWSLCATAGAGIVCSWRSLSFCMVHKSIMDLSVKLQFNAWYTALFLSVHDAVPALCKLTLVIVDSTTIWM